MKKHIKQILSVYLTMCILVGVCIAETCNVSAITETDEYKYKDYFKDYYEPLYPHMTTDFWVYYDEVYEYYSNPDSKEATPDFAVTFCADAYEYGARNYVIGEYLIFSSINYPYELGFYIITLNNGKIYTLTEAMNSEVDGVNEMLEMWCNGEVSSPVSIKRLHDLDGDNKITVREATAIQKHVAGIDMVTNNKIRINPDVECPKVSFLEGTHHVVYTTDINYDGVTNIKDATEIQKHVVGIETRFSIS